MHAVCGAERDRDEDAPRQASDNNVGERGKELGRKEMLGTHTDNWLDGKLQKLTTETRLSEPTRVKYETAIPNQAVDGLVEV